ncbi:hypothetical protein [Methylocystis sp. ATCC 49242]|uniref:hypothetical protein n=1 Tax=Methylocystis sp. ATCC 49242 TaxID=622637 RepID=UPI0001F86AE1|nr:hypothetical protein [Methylocystis sp. ATCC 49242]
MALTGVIIDHDSELGGWLRSVVTPRAMLTPAFDLASWDEMIDALIGYPGAPGVFSVGNVHGMFTTADGGKNWAREACESASNTDPTSFCYKRLKSNNVSPLAGGHD